MGVLVSSVAGGWRSWRGPLRAVGPAPCATFTVATWAAALGSVLRLRFGGGDLGLGGAELVEFPRLHETLGLFLKFRHWTFFSRAF
jgi:hypothetical protein